MPIVVKLDDMLHDRPMTPRVTLTIACTGGPHGGGVTS
jgi:hypothetical protein